MPILNPIDYLLLVKNLSGVGVPARSLSIRMSATASEGG